MSDRTFLQTTAGLNSNPFPTSSQALSSVSLLKSTFHALLDQSPHFIWLLGSEGEVIAANQTALAFGEVNLAQAVDRSIDDSWQFSATDQIRLNSAIAAATTGQVIRYEAVIYKESDDAQTTLDLTLFAVAQRSLPSENESQTEKQNEPVNALKRNQKQFDLLTLVGIDISSRIQLETQLLRSQRLESLGSMTAGIVHDLNNLLAPILAVPDVFSMAFPEAPIEQQKLLKVVKTSAVRAQALCRQALSFIHGNTDPYDAIRSDRLVLDVQTLIRCTLPASISVKTNLPPNLWTIQGNENQLHQVLVNLCLNARDAMPKGGCLELSAENIQIDQAKAAIALEPALSNYVAIRVSDTGVGIPNNILHRIFEPFFTTKAKEKGTGLGLSTAMDIAKSHGGFIDVFTDSVTPYKRGTQFWVYLPAIASS